MFVYLYQIYVFSNSCFSRPGTFNEDDILLEIQASNLDWMEQMECDNCMKGTHTFGITCFIMNACNLICFCQTFTNAALDTL